MSLNKYTFDDASKKIIIILEKTTLKIALKFDLEIFYKKNIKLT